MHPFFARNFIYFPVQAIRGMPMRRCFEEVHMLERMSPADLADFQLNKLRNLLLFAYNTIPYFKTGLDKINVKPRDIATMADLAKLPILTKAEIRENLETLHTKALRSSWRATSGTTGSPLAFPKDRVAEAYMDAIMYTVYAWHGVSIGDRQARLWGRAIKTRDRILQDVADRLFNRKRMSAFMMTEEACIQYYERLMRFKPRFVYGYANAIFRFARTLAERGIDGRRVGIRVVISTGEVLFPHQRRDIEMFFGTKVVNEYGTTENGILGFECELGTMHILPLCLLEIHEPDADGFGNVVVTDLCSRSIPFIRYKTGDRGRIGVTRCACGRPYPAIEVCEGRIDDYIKCPDGRIVYDAILAYILKDHARQFRAYQESLTDLLIYIIPKKHFTRAAQEVAKEMFRNHLGPNMHVEFKVVSDIPEDPSGKFRYFISRIS